MAVLIGARVLFTLGILNLVMALLILFTCRCIPTSKALEGLMKNPAYKRFYKYHCYLWWIFWPSVVVHAVLAIAILGVPF